MSDHIAALRKLAHAPRNRRNIDKALAILEEIEPLGSTLSDWLSEADTVRDAIDTFADRTGEIDAEFLSDGTIEKLVDAVDKLRLFTPEPDSELAALPENIDEAKSNIDELNDMLEDRDYTGDDRDEKWDEITQQLDAIATGLDLLSTLGVDFATT